MLQNESKMTTAGAVKAPCNFTILLLVERWYSRSVGFSISQRGNLRKFKSRISLNFTPGLEDELFRLQSVQADVAEGLLMPGR